MAGNLTLTPILRFSRDMRNGVRSGSDPMADGRQLNWIVRAVPETDMHFASLARAFQADGRGFSPIEGGLEGGGSVS